MGAHKVRGTVIKTYHHIIIALGLLGLTACTFAENAPLQKRWIYVPSNLYVNDNVEILENLLTRASKAGYNGVLFTDYKTFTWWELDYGERWKANAQHLRKITRDLGMDLTVCVFPFGYAGSLLFHDPNLASGMPLRDVPLVARNGQLVPEQTAEVRNGSFEDFEGHTARGWSFQDDPGKSSFIDSAVVKHGQASLRFEDVGAVNAHGHGRVSQRLTVKPWQQYRIRVWMKCEELNADVIQVLVLGGGRTLQHQHVQVKKGDRLAYAQSARNLTTDWVEQSVTFNSLDNTEVNLYAGIWGGKTGKIWWDDMRVDAVPLLNVLRRDSLPLTITDEEATAYKEGVDFEAVSDPGLGKVPWPGNYDTRHPAPIIKLTPNSGIQEGQRVLFSGYHCVLVYGGQVNCSMDDPAVFKLCEEQMRRTEEALSPDGYFMSHDEIRSAGWEPRQVANYKNSGELFAYNIRRSFEITHREGGGKPVYVWSDMYDPNHNAHDKYYQVNNTLEGAWEGLDPRTIIMKWGGGERARPGLQFFADRGHQQMIAAFYDSDVTEDHKMWSEAMKGIPGIQGIMYTTWQNDYSKLEEFAHAWWGSDTLP
jgi:hypothetical protein